MAEWGCHAQSPALNGPLLPPPLLHLYCLLGSTGAINVGSLPSCSWHFYLLSHKALESNESRAEEPLAQRRGGGEMGSSGCISAELALLRPSLPAHCWGKQDSEALASDNCREHPRPSLVSLSELWRPDFSVTRETSLPWKGNQHGCFGC